MDKTKYFLDTKFIEDGKIIDLISIGIACKDGRTLYLQNAECGFNKASDWVWRNVFPHLIHFDMCGKRSCYPVRDTYDSGLGHRTFTKCSAGKPSSADPCFWATRMEIRDAVLEFCDVPTYGKPEFWGYYADYDWVVFCQLFGPMAQLPQGFPMYCRDIKQWADALGDVRIPKPEIEVHHALQDAEWIKKAHAFLAKKAARTN